MDKKGPPKGRASRPAIPNTAQGITGEKRRLLTNNDKIQIIKQIDEGKTVEEVANKFNVLISCVTHTLENRDAIVASGRLSSFKIKKKNPENGNDGSGPSNNYPVGPAFGYDDPTTSSRGYGTPALGHDAVAGSSRSGSSFRSNDAVVSSRGDIVPRNGLGVGPIESIVPRTNDTVSVQSKKKGTSGVKTMFKSNFFVLKSQTRWVLHKHHVDFNPPEDRKHVRHHLMRFHKDKFSGFQFDGSTLFTVREACPQNQSLELISENRDGQRIAITVKNVGVCEPDDEQYMQVFNIILRNCLKQLNLQQVRRKYCDMNAQMQVKGFPLRIWPGYETAIAQYEYNILLKTEIAFAVLRNDTAYDVFRRCVKDSAEGIDLKVAYKNEMLGAHVLTTYNNKSYRIDDVDFDSNPRKTFELKNRQGETTVVSFHQYFQQRYQARIFDLNQPMLVSKSNRKQKRAGMPDLMYLVPELCSLTGLTDEMRSNMKLMREVSNHVRLGPSDRVRALVKFSERLNIPKVKETFQSWKLDFEPDLVNVPGRTLEPEKVVFGMNRIVDSGAMCDWTNSFRSGVSLLCAVKLRAWAIIYPQRSERMVQEFCKELCSIGPPMGMEIAAPHPYSLPDDRATSYQSAINQAINNVNPMMVLCVVPNNKSDRYGDIKKHCMLDRPVPSQVVVYRTIDGSKNLKSICTKIAIQMNCKVGGIPWTVSIPTERLMVIGFDVTHNPRDKRKSFGAMVATLDSKCAHYFSCVNSHSSGEEISMSFALNINKAVERFGRVNDGALPKTIIVYRDGVGDGNVQYLIEQEVKNTKSYLNDLYKSRDVPLKMAFITVTKQHNTRIFKVDSRQRQESNPPPGSIVDDVITIPFRNDFYLVSQSVRQGTVSPTLYNVIHNSTNWPTDLIQKLTYKLTYLYYNWSGTVKVPAPCQYAHKLAFLTGNYLGRAAHANLESLLYFL